MQVFAYRNTERSIMQRMAGKLDAEREARRLAQRAAWDANMRLAELESARRQERIERAAKAARVRRESGIEFRRSYASIEAKACRVFRVSRTDIHSNRRARHLVLARQFVMYWAARLTKLSLPKIGQLMGGKDHTTVLHGRRVYSEKRKAMGRNLRQHG